MDYSKLSTVAQIIITELEKHIGDEKTEITVNVMPLTGKAASKYYQEAVRALIEIKGEVFEVWQHNTIKFIVNKS